MHEQRPIKDRLSVIVVNYNTVDLLMDCLNSLQAQTVLAAEIVVVDNNSSDNSLEVLEAEFPGVISVANRENIGFGRANNLGAASCTSGLIFLLNPDAMARPGCIEAAIRYMDENSTIGLAGTAIFNKDGSFHPSFEYDYPGSHYAPEQFVGLPGKIAWLLGAGLVIRRTVWDQVQGFDPDYFLYGEDIDLCLRIRKAGWLLGYMDKAEIVHLEGQSELPTSDETLFEKKMNAEILFCRKHYPPESVRKIRWSRWLQACWRIVTLHVTKPFWRDLEKNRKKLIKYTVARRVYRS